MFKVRKFNNGNKEMNMFVYFQLVVSEVPPSPLQSQPIDYNQNYYMAELVYCEKEHSDWFP